MDDPGVNVNTDMELEAVPSCVLSPNPDIIPETTVPGAKPGAVHSDGHSLSSEKPGDMGHHPADVREGELCHSPMDDTMARKSIIVLMEIFTVLQIGLDAIIGQIESFFEDATDRHCPGVMPLPSPRLRFPGWWELVHCGSYCSDKELVEMTVHMVHNQWIHAFLCISHPEKKKGSPHYYLFRDEALVYKKFIKQVFHDFI